MSTEIEKSNFPFFEVTKNGNYTHKHTKIEFQNYYDVANKIHSLLEVCRVALQNESYSVESLLIADVLELAQKLIPFDEFLTLDELHQERIKIAKNPK